MNYLDVCTGISAASVAWHPLGWTPAAFSEIEKFPSAVLAHHYPEVPNLGDMTKFKEWPEYDIDVLVGGTPCQSFSVAGLRKGLDDPRGNLMLTYLAIADRYRPEWLVWENVPGVLSSNSGKDFGTLLGGLGELGYGFAYRILDAQYFGVPQRRRRVFVVGCLGGWKRAAAVLFERHSLQGNPAPSRKARKDVAPTLSARTKGGGGLGTDFDLDGGLVMPTLDARAGRSGANSFATSGGLVAGALCAHTYSGGAGGRVDMAAQGYFQPVLPINDMATRHAGTDGSGNQKGKGHGLGIGGPDDPMYTLTKGDKHAVAYRTAGDGAVYEEGDRTAPLTTNTDQCANIIHYGTMCMATGQAGAEIGAEISPTLSCNHEAPIAFSAKDYGADASIDLSPTLKAGAFDKSHANSGAWMGVSNQMQVRRLTPRECERLQGFLDDYTLIPFGARKKIEAEMLLYLRLTRPDLPMEEARRLAADGPRYKALGNSMAVPVMNWIGRRIQLVSDINTLVVT